MPTVSQEFASYYITPSETSPQSFLPSSEKVLGHFPQHPRHPFRFCHCSFIIPVKTPSPFVWLMILPFHFYVLWEKMSKFHSYLSQILKYFDNLFYYPIISIFISSTNVLTLVKFFFCDVTSGDTGWEGRVCVSLYVLWAACFSAQRVSVSRG